MFLNEKPDIVFFTGDLVNNESNEVKDYCNVFNKVKAPLGVYSTNNLSFIYRTFVKFKHLFRYTQQFRKLRKC